jgi:hypothetical protein
MRGSWAGVEWGNEEAGKREMKRKNVQIGKREMIIWEDE